MLVLSLAHASSIQPRTRPHKFGICGSHVGRSASRMKRMELRLFLRGTRWSYSKSVTENQYFWNIIFTCLRMFHPGCCPISKNSDSETFSAFKLFRSIL